MYVAIQLFFADPQTDSELNPGMDALVRSAAIFGQTGVLLLFWSFGSRMSIRLACNASLLSTEVLRTGSWAKPAMCQCLSTSRMCQIGCQMCCTPRTQRTCSNGQPLSWDQMQSTCKVQAMRRPGICGTGNGICGRLPTRSY